MNEKLLKIAEKLAEKKKLEQEKLDIAKQKRNKKNVSIEERLDIIEQLLGIK